MVSFKSTAVFLLASNVATATSSVAVRSRKLSESFIVGYEPKSLVTDHNALDLDQQMMEAQLALGTQETFTRARDIYENGAHSKSVAVVTVTGGLSVALSKGDSVSAKDQTGKDVLGTIYQDYAAGATEVKIQYATNGVQSNYVGCQVGASVTPKTDGCLATSGSFAVGINTFSYTYDVLTNNVNERTLQGFSTGAKEKMYDCPNCPYVDYKKFYDYYGQFDYANQIVLAAFESRDTNFQRGDLKVSSVGYTDVGRSEIIKKGTAYMNVWMYVIREFEDALDDCQAGCINCNDDPVHAWDEGVAFYAGSLEGTDGSGSGVMPYALADKRCINFRTCGSLADTDQGTSHVNIELLKNFRDGQRRLVLGQCAEAKANKDRIVQLMTIPLIQGTLRYADITSRSVNFDEKAEAEGAIFAAAILPMIHSCNADDAATIYDSMRVGQNGRADFQAVKAAFENNYDCLGIKCEDVGGLYDSLNGEYFEGTEPCGSGSSKRKRRKNGDGASIGLIIGVSIGALLALVLVAMLLTRSPRHQQQEEPVDLELKETGEVS